MKSVQIKKRALGIIGLGNMGSAILRAIVSAQLFRPKQILGLEKQRTLALFAARTHGIFLTDSFAELALSCNKILLAVKPQQMSEVLQALKPHLSSDHLVLTIAAGLDLKFYKKFLGPAPRLIRAMPNTPLAVGLGATAFFAERRISDADVAFAEKIFSAAGVCVRLKNEVLIDAVTALSGSGPAYFFLMFEAMIVASVELGLKKQDATLLATQTAVGAAKMLEVLGEDPAVLRTQVTSKGGTTEKALEVLAQFDFAKAIKQAMAAAFQRAGELRKAVR